MSESSNASFATGLPSDAIETNMPFDIVPSLSSLVSIRGRINRTSYVLVQFFQTVTLVISALTAEHIFTRGIQDVVTISTPLVDKHGHGADPIRISILVVFGLRGS